MARLRVGHGSHSGSGTAGCAGQRPGGKLAAEFGAGSDFHNVVHQASGMVAAQLEISVGPALVGLQAYAFGNDRNLTEVAKAVVAEACASTPPAARRTHPHECKAHRQPVGANPM